MLQWLASNINLIIVVVSALAGGYIGMNRRREKQLKACRAQCQKLDKELKTVRRDYKQVLEFNFQDRWTIIELAKITQDQRNQLHLPPEDILLTLSMRAAEELKRRQLVADIHRSMTTEDAQEDFHVSE